MSVDKLSPAARRVRDQRVRSDLAEAIRQLQQLQSSLAVAVSALRQQNADIDADVAVLLQRAIGDPLRVQVEKLAALLRLLSPGAGVLASPARRKR
ncbi:MAG: hypothetical protein ABI885_16665 [Gammaproteobacteria bacterium]